MNIAMKAETKAIFFGGGVIFLSACVFFTLGFYNLGRSTLAGGLIGMFDLQFISVAVRALHPGSTPKFRVMFLFLLKWAVVAGGVLAALKCGFSVWGLLLGFSVILAGLSVAGLHGAKHVSRS